MELLKNLYSIHSLSGSEKKMLKFIKSWVKLNVPDAECIQKDKNIYITRGDSETYPCVVAHTDQVQHNHSKDFEVFRSGDVLFGFSEKSAEQQGLGADDKNGIWVALRLLEKFNVCKVALFHGEEIGCIGSDKADMDFFNDCRFVLQCDRKNSDDFITCACGVELCSDDFLKDCKISDFGYSESFGSVTDVMTLKENGLKISCCNISCGYYNPHTDREITKLSELLNCLNLCTSIFENCTKVYPHEYSYKFQNSLVSTNLNLSNSGNYFGNYNYYNSTEEEDEFYNDTDFSCEEYLLAKDLLFEDLNGFSINDFSENDLYSFYKGYGIGKNAFHAAYVDYLEDCKFSINR